MNKPFKNSRFVNALKNAVGTFVAPLLTLNILDAKVDTWKIAVGGAVGSLLLSVYNWATSADAIGKINEPGK